MSWLHRSQLLCVWLLACFGGHFDRSALAGEFQLRLTSDASPDFTDLPSLVHSVTDRWDTPEEKCIAIWSLARNSRRQTACSRENGRLLWDPILQYNSYGALNCGIVSSLNVACWQVLGYKTRYVELGDHTVSEVSWDDGASWHMFDSSMSFFCYNDQGQVASCQEILDSKGKFYIENPAHQCASHAGSDGWRKAADQPVLYQRTLQEGAASYTDGFEAQNDTDRARTGRRYLLALHPGQSYTRYWSPLEDQPSYKGTIEAADCFRPVAGIDPNKQHDLGNLRGNGVWKTVIDFSNPDSFNRLYEHQNVRAAEDRSRITAANPDSPAWLVVKVSAANVITSMQLNFDSSHGPNGQQSFSVSTDCGITWQEVWKATEQGSTQPRIRLRQEVAGVTDCLVRWESKHRDSSTSESIGNIEITTITQVNRRTLPRLTLGTNEIRLSEGEQLETMDFWPWLAQDEPHSTPWQEENSARATIDKEVYYRATIGPKENNREGFVTWKLELPTRLRKVDLFAVLINKFKDSYVALQVSFDGKNYQELLRRSDDSGLVDPLAKLTLDGERIPENARTIYLRCVYFCRHGADSYTMPGLHDLLVTTSCDPRPEKREPIAIRYEWLEHHQDQQNLRSHTEVVSHLPHVYRVNTSGHRDPTMMSVSISSVSAINAVSPGYSDNQDPGDRHETSPVRYRFGRNLARNMSYRTSRPADAASGNVDTDQVELTNGKIIAATDELTSPVIQPATAYWDAQGPVEVVVDLKEAKSVQGVRVHTHQPSKEYCHPKFVEISTSSDGEQWQLAGKILHDELWHPPADYEAWEHDDDPKYQALPAGGRLAYGFPFAFDKEKQARYVRFTIQPQASRGVGLSELEVFDRLEPAAGR